MTSESLRSIAIERFAVWTNRLVDAKALPMILIGTEVNSVDEFRSLLFYGDPLDPMHVAHILEHITTELRAEQFNKLACDFSKDQGLEKVQAAAVDLEKAIVQPNGSIDTKRIALLMSWYSVFCVLVDGFVDQEMSVTEIIGKMTMLRDQLRRATPSVEVEIQNRRRQ